MSFEATYVYGYQGMIDHTPSGAIAQGEVVSLSANRVGIAVEDIAASATGALATEGVFDVVKAATTGTAFTADEQVFWNPSTNKAVNARTFGCIFMGYAVAAAADAATTVRVSRRDQVVTLA